MNRFTVPIKPKGSDSSNTTALILASIANERMKTMPPVSMMLVDSQHTVLDCQIEAIKTIYPNCDIILIVGHESQRVIESRPKNVRIVENKLYDSAGEAEEIRLGINNCITDNILLVDGNCLFNADALQHLRGHGSCTLIDKNEQMAKDSLGVISHNSKVENIAYGVQDKWCYISYLESKEHNILKRFTAVKNRCNLCTFECLNYVLSHNGQIYSVGQSNGFLRRIMSGKDLKV